MGKPSKRQKKAAITNSYKAKSKKANDDALWDEDSEDEIDAFHKHRDVVPLDINEGESEDEDTEQPIFDFAGEDSDESESDDAHVEKGNDIMSRGLTKQIERQVKYLKQKFGGGEDEMDEDEDENKEDENKRSWGGRKKAYYDADNVDYEIQSSDEDMPAEEEAEVLAIQREKAKFLSMADLGLDEDETDSDTAQVGLLDRKTKKKDKAKALESSLAEDYEEIKKDHSSLSKEEKMDALFSSAPELVGLFSELNEAIDELEKVKPDTDKVKDINEKSGMNRSEAREALLRLYCQSISFYLLLKSEGLPVRDHPVIGRLVEIKNLLEKTKQMSDILPSPIEETINNARNVETTDEEDTNKLGSRNIVNETPKLVEKLVKEARKENAKQKEKEVQIGSQSLEMLKIRANLEAKLKEKGLYNFTKSKSEKISRSKHTNGKLETQDDFDDEQNDLGITKTKRSQLISTKAKKAKLISGDDDLPKRDDIGERRRKHELRVLARVGTKSNDGDDEDEHDENDDGDDDVMSEEENDDDGSDVNEEDESEDEFYKQAKRKRNEKIMSKEQLNAEKQIVPTLDQEEEHPDGKRQISYQIAKNRGLTRSRKKLLKNPRKKYRTKHAEWEKRRKGQVRDVRKPTGPYGGEFTGINPNVSKSVRFKG